MNTAPIPITPDAIGLPPTVSVDISDEVSSER